MSHRSLLEVPLLLLPPLLVGPMLLLLEASLLPLRVCGCHSGSAGCAMSGAQEKDATVDAMAAWTGLNVPALCT